MCDLLEAPGLPDGEQGRGQEEAAGPDLSRFTPRDRTRGLSAALPDDLDDLVALVAAVAPCLDPDAPARGFSVRVRPEVVEHLDHLALRLYRDRGLRRVTHRALAIAALSQLLGAQAAERTPTEP